MHPLELTEDERRVLSHGPARAEDYEIVRRLRDYGFTDSKVQLSHQRDTHGQVLNVVWLGPNTAGKLALERRISSRTEAKNPEPVKNGHSANEAEAGAKNVLKKVGTFLWGTTSDLVRALIVALLFAAAATFIAAHFGISIA